MRANNKKKYNIKRKKLYIQIRDVDGACAIRRSLITVSFTT